MNSKRALTTKQVVRMSNDSSPDRYIVAEELKAAFGVSKSSVPPEARAQVTLP
jgi:hypothetical protein